MDTLDFASNKTVAPVSIQLRELAGRLKRLSYRDMRRLVAEIDGAQGDDRPGALLAAADAIEAAPHEQGSTVRG